VRQPSISEEFVVGFEVYRKYWISQVTNIYRKQICKV